MKKLVMIAAASLFASTAMADKAVGTWKTETGSTGVYLHVDITNCGAELCGTIKRAFDASGAPDTSFEHVGKQMIWDMRVLGDGNYGGGKIWAPDNDKTYKSKMGFKGDDLRVKGCVAGGAICRGQTWTKVN